MPLKCYTTINSFWLRLKRLMNLIISFVLFGLLKLWYHYLCKPVTYEYVLFGKFNQVKNDRQSFDAKPNSCKWELLYCNPNCLKARNSKPSLHNVCTFNTALKMNIKRYWLHQMINFMHSLNRINGLTISKFKEKLTITV